MLLFVMNITRKKAVLRLENSVSLGVKSRLLRGDRQLPSKICLEPPKQTSLISVTATPPLIL